MNSEDRTTVAIYSDNARVMGQLATKSAQTEQPGVAIAQFDQAIGWLERARDLIQEKGAG